MYIRRKVFSLRNMEEGEQKEFGIVDKITKKAVEIGKRAERKMIRDKKISDAFAIPSNPKSFKSVNQKINAKAIAAGDPRFYETQVKPIWNKEYNRGVKKGWAHSPSKEKDLITIIDENGKKSYDSVATRVRNLNRVPVKRK